jgi:hypothetical protein
MVDVVRNAGGETGQKSRKLSSSAPMSVGALVTLNFIPSPAHSVLPDRIKQPCAVKFGTEYRNV